MSSLLLIGMLPNPIFMSDMIDACYTPASFATPDDLGKKAELFDQRKGTVCHAKEIFH